MSVNSAKSATKTRKKYLIVSENKVQEIFYLYEKTFHAAETFLMGI